MNILHIVKPNCLLKSWFSERRISYATLALLLDQSKSSVCNKINGKTSWQQRDLSVLFYEYGLSADFVLGLTDQNHRAFDAHVLSLVTCVTAAMLCADRDVCMHSHPAAGGAS